MSEHFYEIPMLTDKLRRKPDYFLEILYFLRDYNSLRLNCFLNKPEHMIDF